MLGNRYSLCEENENALVAFKRALLLDPECSVAWTLAGHECIEMKKIEDSIIFYRCAIGSVC